MRKTHAAALMLSALSLAGCAVGPAYKRPAIAAPDRARGQESRSDPASLADRPWWEIFKDEALEKLIDEALRNGYDVRLAVWRVEEARANAGIARSEFFPSVQGSAGWSRSHQSMEFLPGARPMNLNEVNLGLSWEIDLWGRVRRLDEAARARYLASEAARRGVTLSLVSDIAAGYFQLRALDEQLEIAKRTREAFQGTYDLFHRRLEGGKASALETASAEASLASTAANVPNLERQIVAQENFLSYLAGGAPHAIPRGTALGDQLLPPEVPAGLPSALLERRPDIREAEQNLVAANADVGLSVANFFPTISLTGAFGGQSQQLGDLFGKGRTWSAGAGLLTPVFQGRRLKNQHRAAVARWEQAKVRYEQSAANAFAEVSTSLVAYQKLAEAEKEQARATAANREAVQLSNERYLAGLSDYLEVLQAQQQLYPSENALAQIRANRLTSLVQLYKALGGGWKLESPEDWSTSNATPEQAPQGR